MTKQSPDKEKKKTLRPDASLCEEAGSMRGADPDAADGIVGRQTPRSSNVGWAERHWR